MSEMDVDSDDILEHLENQITNLCKRIEDLELLLAADRQCTATSHGHLTSGL